MINFIKEKLYRHITLKYLQQISKKKSLYSHDIAGYFYDDITTSILVDGYHEYPYYFKALEFLKEKKIKLINFIDVGANIGTSIIHLYKEFKNIYAFEPLDKTFAILEINTKHLKKIQLYKIALSDTKEKKKIYFDNGKFSGASINDLSINDYLYKKNNESKNDVTLYETVQTNLLDDILPDINLSHSVIKLDIEGEEFNALKGSKKIIDSYRPVFFIEINKREIDNNSSKALEFLRQNNYNFYNIEPKSKPKKNLFSRLFYKPELIVKEVIKLKPEYQLYVCLICIPK